LIKKSSANLPPTKPQSPLRFSAGEPTEKSSLFRKEIKKSAGVKIQKCKGWFFWRGALQLCWNRRRGWCSSRVQLFDIK
jgi:hypothetical protein